MRAPSIFMLEKNWTEKEWDAMRQKLELLSEEELIILCEKCGIQFEGGFTSVKNLPGRSRKEQFILVLDEVDKNELEKEYREAVGE